MQTNESQNNTESLVVSQNAMKTALIENLTPFCRAYLITALWCSHDEHYNRKLAAMEAGYTVHSEVIPLVSLKPGAPVGSLRWTWVEPGESNGAELIHDFEFESEAWDDAFQDMGGGSADEALDRHFDISNLSPEFLRQSIADCAKFEADNAETIKTAIATGEVDCGPDFDETERAGHDFWLSRCGHGCGFFDGDWPRPQGDKLQEAAEAFGNIDLYVGDDGLIYAM